MASNIDSNVQLLATRLGQDRKADRERITTLEGRVDNIASDTSTLEAAKAYSDSNLETAKSYSDSKLEPVKAVADSAKESADAAKESADAAKESADAAVKTVNGASPDAAGNVVVEPGIKTVNGVAPDENGNIEVEPGIKTVNGVGPDEAGGITIDVGVKTVNGSEPDSDGNVEAGDALNSDILAAVDKAIEEAKINTGTATTDEILEALARVETGLHSKVGDEWHSFTGQIPTGGVPYLGQIVTRATYADLWEYVQNHGLVKTEDEWQAMSVAQNGNVPYYSSGDGSTTFRMPKVVGYIKGAASLDEAGGYTAEGLPNITGAVKSIVETRGSITFPEGSGSLLFIEGELQSSTIAAGTGNDYACTLSIDASRSSSIYGNSSHVTPETAAVLFGVYAFGTITNVGALDADTLATVEAEVNRRVLTVNGVAADDAGDVSDVVASKAAGSTGDLGYVRLTNGMQFIWGRVEIAASAVSKDTPLPAAFIDTTWSVEVTHVTIDSPAYVVGALVVNTSTMRVLRKNPDYSTPTIATTVYVSAIGNWK